MIKFIRILMLSVALSCLLPTSILAKGKAISKDPNLFLDIYEEFLNQQSQQE